MLQSMTSEQKKYFNDMAIPALFKELFENGYPEGCKYVSRVNAICDVLKQDNLTDQGILIFGPNASFKTSASVAVAIKYFLNQSTSVYFSRSMNLVKRIRDKELKNDDVSFENYYRNGSKLLIIDGVGKEKKEDAFILLDVIEERSFRKKKTLINTGLSLSEFKDRYGHDVWSLIETKYLMIEMGDL